MSSPARAPRAAAAALALLLVLAAASGAAAFDDFTEFTIDLTMGSDRVSGLIAYTPATKELTCEA